MRTLRGPQGPQHLMPHLVHKTTNSQLIVYEEPKRMQARVEINYKKIK